MDSKDNLSVPIELGGKERRLRLDLNAMATFEEITGKGIFKLDTKRLGVRDPCGPCSMPAWSTKTTR